MAKDTIFLAAKEAYVEHQTDAPVVAVKRDEIGFFPIYTHATPAQLNGEELPEEVKMGAVTASMFGWHRNKITRPALEWLDRKAAH
jgi:hypothetical protein